MEGGGICGFIYCMCKFLQEAIQVQQEWSPKPLETAYYATPWRYFVCVCECKEVILGLECARVQYVYVYEPVYLILVEIFVLLLHNVKQN